MPVEAEAGQRVAGPPLDLGAHVGGHQVRHVGYSTAGGAEDVVVRVMRGIVTVRAVFAHEDARFAGRRERAEEAVDGAEADAGQVPADFVVYLFGGGMVAMGAEGGEDRRALSGDSHVWLGKTKSR